MNLNLIQLLQFTTIPAPHWSSSIYWSLSGRCRSSVTSVLLFTVRDWVRIPLFVHSFSWFFFIKLLSPSISFEIFLYLNKTYTYSQTFIRAFECWIRSLEMENKTIFFFFNYSYAISRIEIMIKLLHVPFLLSEDLPASAFSWNFHQPLSIHSRHVIILFFCSLFYPFSNWLHTIGLSDLLYSYSCY